MLSDHLLPGRGGPQGFRIQPTPEQSQKGKALELYVSTQHTPLAVWTMDTVSYNARADPFV